MVLLILIYIANEVSTNINLSMQSLILFDMFDITSRDATSPEYTSAINTLSSLNIFTYAFAFALPFYKALQDRFGRKPFLIINTVGMALGMLFIMENAPPQHRAKLCSIAKACAILGISTIGLMRSAMVTDDISSWRNVFIIPIIFTIVIAVVGLIFAKETPVYVEQRVAFLETTDDERATAAAAEKAAQQGGGVIKAIKFIARH